MISDRWPSWFKALYGGEWPSNYVTLDTETSGWSHKEDVITEIGHTLVQDNQVVNRSAVILNWADHHIVPDSFIRNQLQYQRRKMELDGKRQHIGYEKMKALGKNPEKVLEFYLKLFETLQANGVMFVGHNILQFDEPMLQANFHGFLGHDTFAFKDNEIMDTLSLEKAVQMSSEKAIPKPGENLRMYCRRLRYDRTPGLLTSLDGHCAKKYKFAEKYGIAAEDMHGAGPDSYCCHILMQEYRNSPDPPKLVTAIPVVRAMPPKKAPKAVHPAQRSLFEEQAPWEDIVVPTAALPPTQAVLQEQNTKRRRGQRNTGW